MLASGKKMACVRPRITAELFTISVDDAQMVYAPLRRAAFLANAAVVNRIADLQDGRANLADEETRQLVEFLRRLAIVDGGTEVPPPSGPVGHPKPTAVTLFLTTACNLRCSYCYASAGEGSPKVMGLDVATSGVDFVVGNALELGHDEIEIAFHGGGEPTLNWPVLVGAHTYAQTRASEHGLRVRSGLATNGVLSDEKIDWILEHIDGVSLSYDGLPEVHDANRRTVDGQGSSARVRHTIRRLDEADFAYGLRLTVTRDRIDRMADSVRYICENFQPRQVQIEPAYQLGRWRDAPSAETQAFIDAFRAARAVARQYGRTILFSAARAGTLCNHFCRATQNAFALTADGQVSACYEVFTGGLPLAEKFLYGRHDSMRKQFLFDLTVLQHLRARTVETSDFCRGCFAKWSCGGDCYYKCLAGAEGGASTGSQRCHIIRELTKDQILERIEASGGLFWHERPSDSAGSADRPA